MRKQRGVLCKVGGLVVIDLKRMYESDRRFGDGEKCRRTYEC